MIDVYKLRNIESTTWYQKNTRKTSKISVIYIYITMNICHIIFEFI